MCQTESKTRIYKHDFNPGYVIEPILTDHNYNSFLQSMKAWHEPQTVHHCRLIAQKCEVYVVNQAAMAHPAHPAKLALCYLFMVST